MRMIRWHEKEFIHFVTNRTQHEMFFLLPTKEVNDLILFWLAKAKENAGPGIELFSFVFMCNHFHLLLRDPNGELPEFMGYFQAHLAKAVNKVIGRRGTFWSREYDDIIVDGEAEFINRYEYIAANPVKAGLVTKCQMWGGISSVPYALENRPIIGVGVNQTSYGNATRHGRSAEEEDHEETFCFSLAPLPMLLGKPMGKQIEFLTTLITDAGKIARKERGGFSPKGMQRVLAQSPFDSPSSPARSPRFKFISFCKEREDELKESYKTFVLKYRECVHVLHRYFKNAPAVRPGALARYVQKAPTIIWPPGCYMSSIHKPVAA